MYVAARGSQRCDSVGHYLLAGSHRGFGIRH